MSRQWQQEAINKIFSEGNRSADTHLLKIWFPKMPNIFLYLKDESTHITGSLKHRLARSLFLYGLCNGWINEDTTIIEASSGNTAVAEAYFALMLGLKFIAVMPKTTSREKIKRIKLYKGECILINSNDTDREIAKNLAQETKGHFMDQFTYAERVVDWRGNNNIAESTFSQISKEEFSIPNWVVCGAGTGGTSSTFGRYIHYALLNTKLCVVDPEDSVLFDYYHSRDKTLTIPNCSRIEGIGRRTVPESFIPDVITRMFKVPDAASIASLYFIDELINLKFGPSTGTTLYCAFKLIAELYQQGMQGSVIAIAGDSGHLYKDSYFNANWIKKKNLNIQPHLDRIRHFYNTCEWIET